MKAQVKSLEGSPLREIELPETFDTPYRPDIIKRAVLALQSTRYQPHGSDPYAGMRTSAVGWGSGRGEAKIPRIKNGSRAARVPNARGGRAGHPPVVEKVLIEKVNKKEKILAIRSAIAATASIDLVRERGHLFEQDVISVVEDAFENLERTSEVITVLEALGIMADVNRSKLSRNIKPGRGKLRGRRYKQRKSLLIVTSETPLRAAANLSGVDSIAVGELNAEHLAPGTHAGRLTLWTESALKRLSEVN
ncbi:MAG: 50S ribosomal protein L4 [Methanocalculus sp.]|uniref:50S ribosomal protein L4 n=1 Tax=Methanocalculus sp. TaxID=2004547 RepID=UPI002725D3A2|nr:50S ribosomal protein L4 [Methanocalculus sp.]MDO8841857.1 50S ribosomal protein L4 [Methanocalculus sp.]MDO9538429.1 50S ribosomal protein L4 [Methanocalculus sp.]